MNNVKGLILFALAIGFATQAAFAGSFTDDRDSKTYKTVTIGNQTWMAENLNYRTKNSWCYDDDNSNCSYYGRLYTWDAAMEACPVGWRLPNNNDYRQLKSSVEEIFGRDMAGVGLKSSRLGFNAVLSGDRVAGAYKFIEETAYLWSADDEDNSRAYDWVIAANSDNFVMGNIKFALKKNGFSVRCIQERGSGSSEYRGNRSTGGTFQDPRDDQVYKLVKIGSQVWMAENLKFRTRTSQCKDGKQSNCSKYGIYYTWYEAQRICPTGFHLPSKNEWGTLWNFVGGEQGKLVASFETIVYESCPYCGTGCGSVCYDPDSRRESYGRISEDECMRRCANESKEVTRTKPSNSTGFSAVLNEVAEGSDAEGWDNLTVFAYWNSSDVGTAGAYSEDDYGFDKCPSPESVVLFSTSFLGWDVEGCDANTLENVKYKYYPVRCIQD